MQIDPKNNKVKAGKKAKDAVDGSAASSSPRSLKNGRLGGLSGSNSSLVSRDFVKKTAVFSNFSWKFAFKP